MKKYSKDIITSNIASESAAVYSPIFTFQNINLRTIHHAREGIKMRYLLELRDQLDIGLVDLGHILNVSLRTLQRYELDYTFDAASSSIIMQLTMLVNKGLDVFGDQSSLNLWMKSSIPELDGATPLDILDTPFGFQLVFQILGRIEHGIFA